MGIISYKTIKEHASAVFVEKKSRFIGYIQPVKTVDDALTFIQQISKNNWNATHNVYAYIIRDSRIKKCSDDGEPQGTAGVPVLDVLEKEGLTDVCVVVTRYFGGIMLGAGGLIRAYSHTAKIAVNAATIVEMIPCDKMEVEIDYTLYGKLNYIFPDYDVIVEETSFEKAVKITFLIPKDNSNTFLSALQELSNGNAVAQNTGLVYHPFINCKI